MNIDYETCKVGSYTFYSKNKQDFIFKYLKSGNFFEKEILKQIRNQNISGIYVDVGANIGNHTLFFSEFCQSEKVYSFECFPETYESLKRCVKNNHLEKVVLHNSACSNYTGLSYMIEGKRNNSGTNKLTPEKSNIEVNVVTIDSILEHADLLKIDVEGDELNVLEGSLKLIENSKPLIILEINPKVSRYNEHMRNYNSVMEMLNPFKYKKIWKDSGNTYIFKSSK